MSILIHDIIFKFTLVVTAKDQSLRTFRKREYFLVHILDTAKI